MKDGGLDNVFTCFDKVRFNRAGAIDAADALRADMRAQLRG